MGFFYKDPSQWGIFKFNPQRQFTKKSICRAKSQNFLCRFFAHTTFADVRKSVVLNALNSWSLCRIAKLLFDISQNLLRLWSLLSTHRSVNTILSSVFLMFSFNLDSQCLELSVYLRNIKVNFPHTHQSFLSATFLYKIYIYKSILYLMSSIFWMVCEPIFTL